MENTELTIFANLLIENGFTVIRSKNPKYTWLYFTKNNRFGYVDGNKRNGYNFSTRHKGSYRHGTGFSVIRNAELIIENAELCLVRPFEFLQCEIEVWKTEKEFIDYLTKHSFNSMFEYYVMNEKQGDA